MKSRKNVVSAVVWGMAVLGLAATTGTAGASEYATEIVSYDTGASAAPPDLEHPTYVNPLMALGEPTRVTAGWPSGTADVTMFNPPWMDTEVVSIGRGGWLTVKFDHHVENDPQNPYGLDLLVFGNAGFVDVGWPNGQTGNPAGLFGNEGGSVSVSQDGLTWVDILGVTVDDLWPTLGFTDSAPPDAFGTSHGGATPTDFTRPVDPAADPSGKTFAQLMALYGGSGGGTGIDLAPTGLDWVQYVRVSVSATAPLDVDIDAFADVAAVPEPATLALVGLGAAGVLAARRRPKRALALLVLVGLAGLLSAARQAGAAPYNLNGHWVEVDYWAGSGVSETIVVIDWNATNGPYVSPAHAWGYRWSGTKYVSDALAAIDAAGALQISYQYGPGFVLHGFYNDADGDQHNTQTPADYAGWWWLGDTTDGGATWNPNAGGVNQKQLAHGRIEGLNMDSGAWTSATLTIPLPEPASLALAAVGAAGVALRRRIK